MDIAGSDDDDFNPSEVDGVDDEELLQNDGSNQEENSSMDQADQVDCNDSGLNTKKEKSIVWRVFDKPPKVNPPSVLVCKLCPKSAKPLKLNVKSTSNLLNHIKNKHPTECAKMRNEEDESSEAISKSNANIAELLGCYPIEEFSQEAFESALVRLIVCEDESFQLVEKDSFRAFIQLLRPSTRVP